MRYPADSRRRRAGRVFMAAMSLAAILALIAANAEESANQPSVEHWKVVQDHLDATRTYLAQSEEIRRADIPEEEKKRRRRELGARPNDAPAIDSAKTLIAMEAMIPEATKFLLDQFPPNHPEDVQQMALDALAMYTGPDWAVVETYLHSAAEIMAALETIRLKEGVEDDESQRLRELIDRGPEPPTTYAIAAAMAIIRSDGARALEAAEFLIEQNYALRPTGAMVAWPWLGRSTGFGGTALAKLVGPNWQVVQDYLDQRQAWLAAERNVRAVDLGDDEMARRLEQLGNRPKAHRASAAAIAILDADGTHQRTRQAAEFLLDHPIRGSASKALKGAEALAAHFPVYDQWPLRLKQLHALSNVHNPVRAFINDLAGTLEDPIARATAQYFAASYLIESTNQQWISEAVRIQNGRRPWRWRRA